MPVTVTVAELTAEPGAGAVRVTGALPGGAWFTYRSAVTAGCSSARPAPMSSISRSSWACAQVSGDAEPAALPSVKPIDATVGIGAERRRGQVRVLPGLLGDQADAGGELGHRLEQLAAAGRL